MNKRIITRLAIILIAVVIAYFQKDRLGNEGNQTASTQSQVQASPKTEAPKLKTDLDFGKEAEAPKPLPKAKNTPNPKPETPENRYLVKNMQIRDIDGSIAYRGDVDLKPTVDRIKAGRRDSHENDGSVFGNRERRLPQKERGYYREYVVRTPGIRHAGPQRLVVGKSGEIYYTHDHYKSFKKIQ